ncbi:MAG TPA: ROK family protein, partial [Thermoanaerobaculia bacterium]|nr:ROK family protein [Thermoanaerobaculia bacterium]
MGGRTEPLALGIDLGATKSELGLVTSAGVVLATRRLPTASGAGPERVVANLAAAGRELLEEAPSEVLGVGVGMAGQVAGRTGVVRSAPNLAGWRDVPLAEALEDALGLPAAITNDVNAT